MTRTERFVDHVRKHLKEYGMTLIFGRGSSVNLGTGGRTFGYFDDFEKVIRVGRQHKEWLDTLVHEYCHFLQWLDASTQTWQVDSRACWIVDDYLFENKKNPELAWAFSRVRDYERDCEIRSVKMIRKWKLPISEKTYIRNANLYVYSYYIMEALGEWEPFTQSPYTMASVVSKMPSTFRARAHRVLPTRIKNALLAYC
jgi:hypothetical protein